MSLKSDCFKSIKIMSKEIKFQVKELIWPKNCYYIIPIITFFAHK